MTDDCEHRHIHLLLLVCACELFRLGGCTSVSVHARGVSRDRHNKQQLGPLGFSSYSFVAEFAACLFRLIVSHLTVRESMAHTTHGRIPFFMILAFLFGFDSALFST